MTEAIADATGGESDLSFTHVGIITVEPDGIYVLEAKSEPGVTMTPLQNSSIRPLQSKAVRLQR